MCPRNQGRTLPRDVTSVHVPVSSRGAAAIAQGARNSAHPKIPAKQFRRGIQISRLQSFTHVQAPTLARPPGCSHRRKKTDFLGGQAVYTAQNPVGYLPRAAASLHARIGQLAWLDSHQLECSLVGCSRTRWTTNRISWSHRNSSNPNRPAEPGRTELPSIGSERKTYFPIRLRFFDPGVCSRSSWAVSG